MKTTFCWMGQRCTVEAPPDLARGLAALFPTLTHVAPPSGPAHVRVLEDDRGLTVIHGAPETCASVQDALSAAELAVTRQLLEGDRAHCHLHAAAVLTEEGEAVLAVGRSGSGKSTLAYAWQCLGRPVFGDDVVALDARGRLHAFPRPLKVDAERLREAGEAPEHTVGWTPGADDAWVDPSAGPGWGPDATPVRILVEIRHVPGRRTRLARVSGGERLRMLLNAVHTTGTSRAASIDRLLAVAEGSDAYRLEHGDARRAARRLLELAAGTGC